MKRLEPSAENTSETVELKNAKHTDGLIIPQNGSASVFVWNGAFADGSMSMKPLSENYKIQVK